MSRPRRPTSRCEVGEEDGPSLDRAREQHLERAALALARDGERTGADGDHPEHGDDDRVLRAERQRAAQAEQVAGAELAHLLEDRVAAHELADQRAEVGVDERQQPAPGDERSGDERNPRRLPAPDAQEERPDDHSAAASTPGPSSA